MKRAKQPILAFSITFIIGLIAFAMQGLHPFGDKQIMIIDSWHQYYPILQQLHYKLTHGQSLFYALNTGMGTNFYLMIAYYAMSPLNLLSIVVPHAYIREFLAFVTLLKIALSAGFFTSYLQVKHRRKDLSTIIFGIAYGFCGFILGYYWNVMWLDIVMLTPLSIWGLEKILKRESPVLYVVALSLALISNFYAAYFLCVFIALYTVVILLSRPAFDIVNMLKDGLRALAYSLLSIMLAAVVIVPVYYGMQSAYALASKDPSDIELYHNLLDLFARFASYIEPTSIDGLPNLTIGGLALVLSLLYFTKENIHIKERIAHGALLILLLFSTTFNYLDFYWHAFHFPNQVPHRFTFLICFTMISIAYSAFIHIDKEDLKRVGAIVVLFIGVCVLAEHAAEDDFVSLAYMGTIVTLIIYAVMMRAYIVHEDKRGIVLAFILGMVIIESGLSMFIGITYNRMSTYSTYPVKYSAISSAVDYIKLNDDGIYRIETTPYYSANDPLLYNYMGISQFSSTANAGFNGYTEILGMSSSPGSNSYKYLPNTPVANGLLNLKYLIDKDKRLLSSPMYHTIKETDDLAILENRTPFPFGFASRFDLYTFNEENRSPFVRQTVLMQKITGVQKTLFTPIASNQIGASNIETKSVRDISHNYKNIDKGREGSVEMQVTFPHDGQVYVYVKNSHKKMDVSFPDDTVKKYDPRKGVIVDLGYVKTGESATFNISLKAQKSGYFDFEAVYFGADAFRAQYDEIIRHPFMITSFDEGHIEGTIDMPSNELLYLAMPFDEGWSVTVDGESAELDAIEEGISILPLDMGKHDIVLHYTSPGFSKGMMISSLGVLICILLFMRQKYTQRARVKVAKVAEKDTQDDEAIPETAHDDK